MKVIETICECTYKQGQLIVGFSMYMIHVCSSGSLPYICMRWQTLLNDLCEACFSELPVYTQDCNHKLFPWFDLFSIT